LRRKKKDAIITILEKLKFDPLNNDGLNSAYDYLIKMPMDSVTEEAVEKLMRQKGEKEAELNALSKMKIETIWLNELEKLKNEYVKLLNTNNNIEKVLIKKKITIKKKINK